MRKHSTQPQGATESTMPRPRTRPDAARTDIRNDMRHRMRNYGRHYPMPVAGGAPALAVHSSTAADAAPPTESTWRVGRGALDYLRRRRNPLLIDALAILVATLDVAMAVPSNAATYSLVLSAVAVFALVFRRVAPFTATLVALPGFLVGWSELGAMIALGTLAWKRGWSWRTIVAAVGVWFGRFIIWSSPPLSPLHYWLHETWRHHMSDGIYACFVVAMPIAIGLLVTTRHDLSARIVELAASRGREQRLQAIAVRADERAKIAREMHDVVSHQVSLIAMQAGALQVASNDELAVRTAAIIRGLSTRTLDELRNLVGTLRTATDGADEPDLDTLLDLVRESTMDVKLDMDLAGRKPPGPVASAAYRTVQEALTNVRKHASAAATTVRIMVENGELRVHVTNDPPVTNNGDHNGHPVPAGELPGGGHGLIGLRERATLLGGAFTAAPTDLGGFDVRASFPLPPEA